MEWSLDYLNDSADVRSMSSSMRERSDRNESSLHDGAGATSISCAHRSAGGGNHENAGRSPCMIGVLVLVRNRCYRRAHHGAGVEWITIVDGLYYLMMVLIRDRGSSSSGREVVETTRAVGQSSCTSPQSGGMRIVVQKTVN